MTDSDADAQSLLTEARPSTQDAVAAVLRAKVRAGLLGSAVAPAKLGRFSVLQCVGSGAGGTVYAAYDPILDRRVALKILAPSAVDTDALLEEARALAKLRHPNVVAVHEAGAVGEQVYVAMEFVDGGNFRAWLDAQERTAEQIVDALVEAGHGLVAAHEAGIAHGDFKPDNLLVADDGVRVADFGMARTYRTDATDAGGGTPAYMAPERFRGGPPTPAADQFAFAVTLVEALTGKRPFEGRTVASLHTQIEHGSPEIPRSHGAAGRALKVAKRGLERDPTQRFASMQALLTALAPTPRVVGTQRTVLLAAILVAAAAVGVVRSTSTDPCDAGTALANEVAGPEVLRDVEAVLAIHTTGLDASLPNRVGGRLSGYREDWVSAHRAACEATRVDGTQSDTLFDLRMRCLEQRRRELAALGSALMEVSDAREAARAVDAVDALIEVGRCDADHVSSADYREPDGVAARQEAAVLRSQMTDAWADYHLARYETALAAAQTIEPQTTALAFPPLAAEAAYLLGTTQARVLRPAQAETTLRRARVLAASAQADGLAADVSVQLLRTVMFAGEPGRVTELSDFVFADVARSGRSSGEVEGIVGEALLHAGDPTGALEAIESALAHETRPDRRAMLLSNRASARLALGQTDGALADYQSALAIAEAHYGAQHPTVGFFVHRVGRGLLAAGNTPKALATLAHALELREAALGPDDRAVASTLIDLAMAAREAAEFDRAQTSLDRALEIRRKAYGGDHPSLAEVHDELAKLAAARDGGR